MYNISLFGIVTMNPPYHKNIPIKKEIQKKKREKRNMPARKIPAYNELNIKGFKYFHMFEV
jgi:tRNA1(Val) A37 N6-methylase TrmN6